MVTLAGRSACPGSSRSFCVRTFGSFVASLAIILSVALSAGAATAAPASSPRMLTGSAQEIGDEVTVNNLDGEEVGVAAVTVIEDPYEEAEQEPERDLRFLSVEVEVENTGEDQLIVDPANIGVVDDAGIIYVDNPEITRTDRTDPLTYTELEPGETISGSLEVGFPEDGEIAQIIWLVDTGVLPILVDNLDRVDIGDPVNLFTVDYEEEAIFTAEEVIDGYDEFAPSVELNPGWKFVGVTVSIENVSADPIEPVADSIFLTTSDGIFWAQDPSLVRSDDAVDEVPDLTSDPIAPGESVTGFVGFGVPEDVEIVNVFYLPDSVRLIRIYDAEAAAGDDEDEEKDSGGLGPIGRNTPTPGEDDDDTGSTGDECEGAAEWAELTIGTLDEWGSIFSNLEFEESDPDTLAAIEDAIDGIRDLAEEQAESTPPPAAEELNELITTAYEDSADALETLHEGASTGDSAMMQDALTEITEIGANFQSGDVADVVAEAEEACPELSDL
jgi:hypothetical protein